MPFLYVVSNVNIIFDDNRILVEYLIMITYRECSKFCFLGTTCTIVYFLQVALDNIDNHRSEFK